MRFSVLLPIYIKESAAFFSIALDSIIEQTIPPDEIVIVADGPLTNELNLVIEHYVLQFPDLFNILRLEKNMGMGYAMDIGVRTCRNEWIARMDSDDISQKNRFEKQVEYLTKFPEVDVLGTSIEEFINAPGDLSRERKVPECHGDIKAYMKSRSPMNHMTVFFRKEKVLTAGSYWHKQALEDYYLWYKMITHGAIFHNLPFPLVYARVGNNMIGRRRGRQYVEKEKELFKIMKKDQFISTWEYYRNVLVRIFIRMMPQRILEYIYDYFLRRRKKTT